MVSFIQSLSYILQPIGVHWPDFFSSACSLKSFFCRKSTTKKTKSKKKRVKREQSFYSWERLRSQHSERRGLATNRLKVPTIQTVVYIIVVVIVELVKSLSIHISYSLIYQVEVKVQPALYISENLVVRGVRVIVKQVCFGTPSSSTAWMM